MADLTKTHEDPKAQLWDQLDDVHAVMLGSPDPAQHMQPMAPMIARDEEAIWFFTRKDSELVRALGAQGGTVHLCVTGDDGDYHACLHGQLVENKSQAHIDRFWSSVVEAWFDGGKDDPALTMLCFKPHNARVWASTGSTLKFGWEIAKANLTDGEPDVGVTADITFRAAA